MSLNIKLLRDSFQAVAPKGDELMDVFYATLMERYPQVKPLFGSVDMKAQKKKLLASLVLVMNNLERPDDLTSALHGLGAKHVGYGAEAGHYDAVGECLLHALNTVAGELWNDELEHAWSDAYGAVASLMKEGAALQEGTAQAA